MKLLLMGDSHLTTNRPENRTDDYFQSQFEKIKWIYELAKAEECMYVLQPGDFFDSHKANDFLKQFYIKYLLSEVIEEKGIETLTIFGQHDLRYHGADRDNTPLTVLHRAHAVHIIQEHASLEVFDFDEVLTGFYGCSWGEQIISPTSARNILLIHRLVIYNEKHWEGQTDFDYGLPMLLENKRYDLIVCGDNHESFVIEKEGRKLVNCGSLMRSRIDQANHQPCVYIYDTITKELDKRLIPVRPISEVMDLDKAQKEKKKNKELDAFIEKLQKDVKIEGLDFTANLASFLKENEIPQSVQDIIGEAMNE